VVLAISLAQTTSGRSDLAPDSVVGWKWFHRRGFSPGRLTGSRLIPKFATG